MTLRELLKELQDVNHTKKTSAQLLDMEVEFFTGYDDPAIHGLPLHLFSVYENGKKIAIDIGVE